MSSVVSERLAAPAEVLLGCQTPRVTTVPPTFLSSSGQEAVELAAIAGLALDPWQQLVLDQGLRERSDGKWAAFEVAVNVPRQNGKGGIIEARELAGLFLLGERLILHSAHEFKDLDLTTPVLTANRGWSTMGEIREGDEVFAPDGAPTKVVGAHPVLRDSDCYRVTFADGQEFVAGAGHLWQMTRVRRSGATESCVVTTADMLAAGLVHSWERENGRDRHVYQWRADLPAPFQAPELPLPVDPYLLGAWLGDGNSRDGKITSGARDLTALLAELDALGETYSLSEDRRTAGRVWTVGVRSLTGRLRGLGVLGAKRIPDAYLRSSEAQRRSLLAGILDTDGTVSAHQVAVTMVKRDLMEDIVSLVRSLGYRATLREFRARLNGQDAGPMWRVQFSAGGTSPFRLKRKNAAIRRLKASRSRYNAVVGIERVPTRPTRCITVAHESGCYVVGRGFTVTHNTSIEAFRRIESLIVNSDQLRKRVDRVRRTTGEEAIELIGGQRLRFLARSGGSGRGFTGDCNILDEAMILGDEAMGALMPTMAAVANPQIWYLGSAGIGAQSSQLGRLRRRAVAAAETGEPDPSLAYFEWSIDPHVDECRHDCRDHDDVDDPRSHAKANPAMGIRITPEHVRNELLSMGEQVFARERLGVGSYPSDSADTWAVIKEDAWRALADGTSRPADPVVFAIDATPERSHAAICVAGQSGTAVHVEVVDHRPGIGWVVDRAVELHEKWEPAAVVIDAGGPAGSLIADLEKRGVEVTVPKTREIGQATGQFIDSVTDQTTVHLDQAPLAAALAGAELRPLGDASAWARRGVSVDISPLVSGTLARWGFVTLPEEEETDPLDNIW